ncbi:hypothetical protein GGD63_006264 [Bradyrhizobium sp. cir1]|uniref:hypothetical protein n=1 Tax=Bradyrhizobium sp. cir1 TaxID=1445730 RepID=UPI0016066FED|nr:hypothetical protein [Bradyrhizobium sp. cir1]MBB4373441.1 hypothetical protein [Bradyrhizobium sp. cir1]
MTGKWSTPGVPHKGWVCDGVEDLGAPDAVCEMCESQDIRYVHSMSHPDYEGVLDVGCVCAERMEDDYVGPRRRERALRGAARRKSRWLDRRWRISSLGNSFVNTDGFNITIFQNGDGSWGGRLTEKATGRFVTARRRYESEAKAKLAAFDGMIFLKDRRGWGG